VGSVATGPVALTGLQCPVADVARYAAGVAPLTEALADRTGVEPRLVGTPTTRTRKRGWEEDLASGRGCLLEAGGQLDDALEAGAFPVIAAGECGVALGTLPVLAARRPEARVLWLDAHGDFNSPETSESGWLGGMGLAGACGIWDSGLGRGSFPAAQVVLCGVRDLDAGERTLLDRAKATVIGATLETLVYLVNALDDAPVYVHLDPDVLDPEEIDSEYRVDNGITVEKLWDLCDAVAQSNEVVGLEIASFWAPEDPGEARAAAAMLAEAVEPLLPKT
jgi:arginase